ncbi:UNVERIFIED_CONTAM: hypothetical protein K2H54_049891 [Gekko kuhli]
MVRFKLPTGSPPPALLSSFFHLLPRPGAQLLKFWLHLSSLALRHPPSESQALEAGQILCGRGASAITRTHEPCQLVVMLQTCEEKSNCSEWCSCREGLMQPICGQNNRMPDAHLNSILGPFFTTTKSSLYAFCS